MPEIIIRTISPQEWKNYKDLRLRALADSPDAFGSTLAEEEKRSDSAWKSRLAGDDSALNYPLGAEVDGEKIGLAWGRIKESDPDLANLYQMWVAPSHRGLGVGEMLLKRVIAWAVEKDALVLELGVTVRDSSAMRLYTRLGFEPVGETEPLRPGSAFFCQSMRLKLQHK